VVSISIRTYQSQITLETFFLCYFFFFFSFSQQIWEYSPMDLGLGAFTSPIRQSPPSFNHQFRTIQTSPKPPTPADVEDPFGMYSMAEKVLQSSPTLDPVPSSSAEDPLEAASILKSFALDQSPFKHQKNLLKP
jgi:hypothetical protein